MNSLGRERSGVVSHLDRLLYRGGNFAGLPFRPLLVLDVGCLKLDVCVYRHIWLGCLVELARSVHFLLLYLLRAQAWLSHLAALAIGWLQPCRSRCVKLAFRRMACQERFPHGLFLLIDVDEGLRLLLGHEVADELGCCG